MMSPFSVVVIREVDEFAFKIPVVPIDSQRNRSMLQRLSLVCPRKVNHDGPAPLGIGR
jgi:hypothetical protein